MCLCARPPQIAPQTWIITLKRTTTATHRSRKPVTTQFTARSALHCSGRQISQHFIWNFKYFERSLVIVLNTQSHLFMCCIFLHFSCNCCKVSMHIFSPLQIWSQHAQTIFRLKSFCRPFTHYRIFTTKTTRSESPRSPGGKWSEPPPWPEWVASPTIIDYRKRLQTRADCGASFKRGSAHTMFHLFKPLEPCGRACKWTLWAHWTNPNGLYGERLWMSNPVAELLRDVISLSPAVMQI